VKFTTADGRKLTYRRMGTGPTMVCHPGGPGFSSSYFADLAGLWERFTLVMLNPRGTGGSDRPSDPRAYQIDDYVADVAPTGEVRGLRPGDTAVVVSYRGNVVAVRVLVPGELPPGMKYPDVPEVNFIDREVFAKLRRLNVVPSELASDNEFLRRVTLDLTGRIPSPQEVTAFAADKAIVDEKSTRTAVAEVRAGVAGRVILARARVRPGAHRGAAPAAERHS